MYDDESGALTFAGKELIEQLQAERVQAHGQIRHCAC